MITYNIPTQIRIFTEKNKNVLIIVIYYDKINY